MAFSFKNLKSISTNRLVLRMMTLEDAEDVFEFTSSEIGKDFLSWEPHKTVEQTRGFLRSMQERHDTGLPVQWGVELKEEKKIIGIIGIVNYYGDHNRGEFTYILSQNYLGKGYMTEASEAFFRFCFEEMKLNRLEGKNEPDHYATHKIIEKLGMKREGMLRSLLFQKGRYRDYIWWSILADEYFELHKNRSEEGKEYKVF